MVQKTVGFGYSHQKKKKAMSTTTNMGKKRPSKENVGCAAGEK